MKHINVRLNDKQSDNLKLLFEIAFDHARSQDAAICELLPEEIDELDEVLQRGSYYE